MHFNFLPTSLLRTVISSTLEQSLLHSLMILQEDQVLTFSGLSSSFPASVVHGKHNSLFNCHYKHKSQHSSRHQLRKTFGIRFNSFHRRQTVFISTLFNSFKSFIDTLQLTPSFNRDGRRRFSAAMLEPVWICDDPIFET